MNLFKDSYNWLKSLGKSKGSQLHEICKNNDGTALIKFLKKNKLWDCLEDASHIIRHINKGYIGQRIFIKYFYLYSDINIDIFCYEKCYRASHNGYLEFLLQHVNPRLVALNYTPFIWAKINAIAGKIQINYAFSVNVYTLDDTAYDNIGPVTGKFGRKRNIYIKPSMGCNYIINRYSTACNIIAVIVLFDLV